MLTQTTKLLTVIIFALALCSSAFAQQQQPSNQTKEPEYVSASGFKGKIFEIKNDNTEQIYNTVVFLTSGFKGASIGVNATLKTITVRDFPENIAAIEAAIKRLDVPSMPHSRPPVDPDVEVVMHVLIASNDEATTTPIPADIKDVIKQLQTTFAYKNYQLLTPIVFRARLVSSNINGKGTASLKLPGFNKAANANYAYSIRQILPDRGTGDNPKMIINGFTFNLISANSDEGLSLGQAEINTNLSVRDGEKIVVGTASLKDKALILVLSLKVVK